MSSGVLDMDEVTIELSESELEEIDDMAFKQHRGNREAAIRELLDQWIKSGEE